MLKYLIISILALNLSMLAAAEKKIIRVGHFPNITHAQAVIGHHFTREAKGWFEKFLGPDIEIEWYVYNAGPSVMEGIFAGSIDLAYVGPSPTINAYVKSKGDVRVVCGSCSGGAALVVRKDSGIKTDADFRGKRIGTPQLGNTQDVAARSWLKSIGLNVTLTGGDAFVIPSTPASQFQLFKQGELDASWSIEPWVSRLLLEGNGELYFEESKLWKATDGKYVTTHIVSNKRFLDEHPELVKKWIEGQISLTQWIRDNFTEAKQLFAQEVKQEVRFSLPQAVMERAWKYIDLTHDPIRASLMRYAAEAYAIGFLKKEPDLKDLYDLKILNTVLEEQGKKAVFE